jgi:hypothetical protein
MDRPQKFMTAQRASGPQSEVSRLRGSWTGFGITT